MRKIKIVSMDQNEPYAVLEYQDRIYLVSHKTREVLAKLGSRSRIPAYRLTHSKAARQILETYKAARKASDAN